VLWCASFSVTYDGEAVISKRMELFVGVNIRRAYLLLVCGGGRYLLNKFTAGILFKNMVVYWGRGGTKAAAGAGIGDVVKTTVQRMREEASGTRNQGTIEGREAGSRHDMIC